MTSLSSEAIVGRAADQCVACGLCLPHCPTYQLSRDEAESPRGRIALARALARGDLPPSARLASHLARCLGCRACERVCPSRVPYGELIDHTRAVLAARRSRRALPRALDLLTRPVARRLARRLLRAYQRSGMQRLMRRSGILRRHPPLAELNAELARPVAASSPAPHHPALGAEHGRVALFLGCVGSLADDETLRSTIEVLTRLGYAVHVPPRQGCCGALPQHLGDARRTAELARANLRAFDAEAVDAIIVTASGCAATLAEYGRILPGPEAARFATKVRDVSQFLTEATWGAPLAPLARRVALHDPCTLRNVLRQERAAHRLLARIPGLSVLPLPGNDICCGAAGAYHLSQPQVAGALRAAKIAPLVHLAPDALATSHIGCALYLEAGLRAQGLAIEVLHPVTLIARQLRAGATPGLAGSGVGTVS